MARITSYNVCYTKLLRIDSGDEAGLAVGVFLALFGVELASLAGDALSDDLGVLVDEYRHVLFSPLLDGGNDLGSGFGHGSYNFV